MNLEQAYARGAKIDTWLRRNPEQGDSATLAEIKKVVTAHFRIKQSAMHSPKRTEEYVRARQIVMWLAHRRTDLSNVAIGRHLGGRDHTTVQHGIKAIERLRQTDSDLWHDIEEIEGKL